MGLDIAEFLLTLQEEFQIDIAEEDCPNMDTFEELVTYIERKIAESPRTQTEADGLFQEGFFTIRRFFNRELGIDSSLLTPVTKVAPLLLPLSHRRRVWKKLRKEMSKDIPSLVFGESTQIWTFGICASICFLSCCYFIRWDDWGCLFTRIIPGVFTSMLAGLFFGIISLIVSAALPFRSTIPKACDTLGDIVRLAIRTEISLDPEYRIWTRETIAKSVMRIASEQMGVPVEKISLTESVGEFFG